MRWPNETRFCARETHDGDATIEIGVILDEVYTCDSFLFTPEQNLDVISALLGALEN
jgi:hypothetical protein